MKKILFGSAMLLMVLLAFSGCDMLENGDVNWSDIDWDNVSTEWSDTDDSQFSLVPGEVEGSYFIDIGWYTDPEDINTWVMGYIEENKYTITNNSIIGKYDDQNTPDTEELDITITFSYSSSSGVLTLVVDADGVLGNKTLNLTPSP